MKAAFFGQYLMDKGVINFQQLSNAVAFQESINLKIGQLVLEKKMLVDVQVKNILEFQRKNDLYFGEAAQKLGLLTNEQIEMLLAEQKKRHIFIGQALVKLGYLTENEMKERLVEFSIEQNEDSEMSSSLYPEEFMKEKFFIEQFAICTAKFLYRIGGVIAKYGKCEVVKKEIALAPVAVEMVFEGGLSSYISRYLMMSGKDMANIIAVKFFEGCAVEVDNNVVMEAMSELVNMICVQICSRFEEYGKLKVTLPEKILTTEGQEQQKYILGKDEKALFVSLVTPYGSNIGFLIVFLDKKNDN